MPTFNYSARNVTGSLQQGEIELPTREEVVGWLRNQKLIPVRIEEKQSSLNIELPFGSRIKNKDVVIFTRQFATMINAGLPLVQSLDILASQSENKKLAEVTSQVQRDVETGHTLADALRKHPKVFTDLYVNMVAAGEVGGILDVILLRLATFLEKNDALVRKIKGAMVYPAVIFVVAIAAVATLLIVVIPTFQNMFEGAGVALPGPTLFVIFLSETLQTYWYVVLGAIIGLGILIRYIYSTDGGELAIDRMLLRMPILGTLLRKSAVARFTRTLGTLVSSGVSILDGLEITARTAGNRVIQDAVMESRASIAGGETIAEPLRRSGVFPPMVVQMINVGEQTGALDDMLSKIADFYEDEVDEAVEALLSALEPVMIVFLGGIVGGMIVAMYLPIFDMINAVQ
ncbi:MAG: type II secretion system F family protein [Gemmatimonadetes bacterium]|nr:type II secretion system F family protein [Pseudomonadales bacterium]NIW37135.1 type II secretion system F family protein [Gemmatimonadota bacterium]NIX08113.1 type II secretion system F family protein [Pseudomonadales bacterium]